MKKSLSFFVILLIGFVVGYYTRPQADIVVKTEYKTDTVRIAEPQEVLIDTFIREVVVPKTIVKIDTLYTTDSVIVYLPFERKVYEDSLYRAVVSGYKPVLEELEVYSEETIIYKEKVAPLFSPYVTGGIGLNGDISIGGGLFVRDKDGFGVEYGNRGLQIKYTHKF